MLEELILLSSKANKIINSKELIGPVLCNEYRQKVAEIVHCKSVQELLLKNYGSAVETQEDSPKICYLPLEEYKVHLRSKNEVTDPTDDKMDIDGSKEFHKVSDVDDLLIKDSESLKVNNGVFDPINHKDSGFYTDGESIRHNPHSVSGNCNFEEFRILEEVTNSENTIILNFDDNSPGNNSEVPVYNCTYEEYRNVDVFEEIEEDNDNYFSIKTTTISSVVKTASYSLEATQVENESNFNNENGRDANPSEDNIHGLIHISPHNNQEANVDRTHTGKQEEIPLLCIDDEDSNYPPIENSVNDGVNTDGDFIRISNTYSLNSDTQDWHLEDYFGNISLEVEVPTSNVVNEITQNTNEVVSKNDFFQNSSLRSSLENQNIECERNLSGSDTSGIPLCNDDADVLMLHNELRMANNTDKIALLSSIGDCNNSNVHSEMTSPETINPLANITAQDTTGSKNEIISLRGDENNRMIFEITHPQAENLILNVNDSQRMTFLENGKDSEFIPTKTKCRESFNSSNLCLPKNKRRKKNVPDGDKLVFNTRSRSSRVGKEHSQNYRQRVEKTVSEEKYSNKQHTKVKNQTKTSYPRGSHLSTVKAHKEKLTISPTIKRKKENSVSRRFGYSSSRVLSMPSAEEKAKTREEKVQKLQERREKMERQREERIRIQEERRKKKFEQHEELLREKIEQVRNKGRIKRGRKAAKKDSVPNIEASEEVSKLDRTYLVPKTPKLIDLSSAECFNETVVKSSSDSLKGNKLSNILPTSLNGVLDIKEQYKLRREKDKQCHVESPTIHHRKTIQPIEKDHPDFGYSRKEKFPNGKRTPDNRNFAGDKTKAKPRIPKKCISSKQRFATEKYLTRQLKRKLQLNSSIKQSQLMSNSEIRRERSLPPTHGSLEVPYEDAKLKMKPSVVLKRLDDTTILEATLPYNTPKEKQQNLQFFDPKLSILKPKVILKDISPQIATVIRKNNAKKPRKQFGNKQTNSMENILPECSRSASSKKLIAIADDDNYEMSDFNEESSDDSDATPPKRKRIPMWALGLHLKEALIHQHYMPPNTDEIFGTFGENNEVDLVEIFSIDKPYYRHRTSSATWSDKLITK
ncbi:hypothetical protein JTE90_014757 [Oedothorax gibbosus]|uniref:Inner centromere protein ARK-binding domain-containing protein n=1 Tax=Oedothorax gibbosus TaxID=931172 RepID=A0AAV6USQ5_9ARAC|nr:hypothetical protein JTE90_014757 [Oedothorax gibbosus]